MHSKPNRKGEGLRWGMISLAMAAVLSSGCGHLRENAAIKSTFREANDLFNQGEYQASLQKYEQIVAMNREAEDRALFEMGIIHTHPKNPDRNHQQAVELFQRLVTGYPESEYRQDSEMMIFYLNNVAAKDQTIAKQQNQIEALQKEIATGRKDALALRKTIEDLEQKIFAFAIKLGPADKILVEKKARRLMLISNGTVIKTYKIALGGNPEGPKECQGDNKTPEGIYYIEAKNKDSQYHLALRLSYPNEQDKRRARELGVPPGGDIMIHGIKNGFSWVGEAHAEVDWTRGCIAVTDREIEEINTFAPVGTMVEIRP